MSVRSEDTRPPRAPTLVSVVIPVRNGAQFLQHQLDALARQRPCVPFEVVVADNGSEDDTVSVVLSNTSRIAQLRLVDAGDRQGAAHARNVGMHEARGDFIAFCDADDIVADDWINALLRAARGADLVAGRLETRVINPPRALVQRGTAHLDEADAERRAPIALRFLPYAVSANLGVWRYVIDAIGDWDERYRVYMEDVDFSWRAQLQGFELAYAADAVVHYRLRGNLRTILSQTYRSARNEPLLAAVYQEAGAQSPLVEIPGRARWLLRKCWHLLRGQVQRALWLRRAVTLAGLIRGGREVRAGMWSHEGIEPVSATGKENLAGRPEIS